MQTQEAVQNKLIQLIQEKDVVKPFTSFESKVMAAFTAAMLVVAVLMAMTWGVARDAADAARRIAHTQEVLNNLARVRTETVQIELSTQSYRISGDPARLAERNATMASREVLLRWLKVQTSDNVLLQTHWAQLRQVLDERVAIAQRVEELRKTQGQEAASAFAASAPLQATRQRTDQILQTMEEEERHVLETRRLLQANARERLLMTGVLVSVVLLVMLCATYVLIRRQLRETQASQRALAESEESLSTTLDSIGDAVMATDTQGRITRMNPVAMQLTGWSFPEAQGRFMNEVFCIVNEHTRAPAEVPLAKVLATGAVHERENHSLLIAKDGTERPITDSAAPIRNSAGGLEGVVIVFRDETVARQAKETIRDQNRMLEQRVQQRTSQLQESEHHLRLMINSVPALIAYVDARQRYVYANRQYQERFAPGNIDITGSSVREILGERLYQEAAPLITKVLQGQSQSYDWQPFPGVWMLSRYEPQRNEQGLITGYFVLSTDISERKNFELAQREAAIVFESSYEGIMVADAQGLITRVNPAFTRITGYEAAEITGCSPRILSSGLHDAHFYQALWASLIQHDFWRGEFWNRNKAGELYAVLQSISVVRDPTGGILYYVSVFADITPMKHHEAALDRVANYDALTDLPNRRLLSDRLTQAIHLSDRSGKLCAICFLDLDGFKLINDQLGHPVGDQLLISVATNLKLVLRAGDTLSRLGGDEFVLLLSDLTSLEECLQILDRVLATIRAPVKSNGHVLNISASIGVSLYPADKSDPDTLLRHADQAMYLAKKKGKNRFQLYDPETDC